MLCLSNSKLTLDNLDKLEFLSEKTNEQFKTTSFKDSYFEFYIDKSTLLSQSNLFSDLHTVSTL